MFFEEFILPYLYNKMTIEEQNSLLSLQLVSYPLCLLAWFVT